MIQNNYDKKAIKTTKNQTLGKNSFDALETICDSLTTTKIIVHQIQWEPPLLPHCCNVIRKHKTQKWADISEEKNYENSR